MPRARTICPKPGCANVQPCQAHARKPWDHGGQSRQARGLGKEHDANRRAMGVGRGALCGYCHARPSTTLDHQQPRARGGQSTLDNSVPACGPCHDAKTRRERRSA